MQYLLMVKGWRRTGWRREILQQAGAVVAHLFEQAMQLGELRTGKLRAMLGDLSAQMACLARQSRGALHQSLGLTGGLFALFEFLVQTQESAGVFEQPAATLPARHPPAGVQGLDLTAGELVPHDLLGQPLTGLAVDAHQRHQDFHRGLGGDLPLADRLLNRRRKLPHQGQTPRHPAGALDEAPGQLLLAPPEAMLQLGEQPPLLEIRAARGVGHLPLQDQRLGLPHLPHHSLDRVVAQTAQRLQTLVPVDDHVAPRCLAVGNHHDGLLLAVLFQRQTKPALALATANSQRRVRRLQLVEFQFHDRLLRHTSAFGGQAPAASHRREPAKSISDPPGGGPSASPQRLEWGKN
jgi:hypothetical protein